MINHESNHTECELQDRDTSSDVPSSAEVVLKTWSTSFACMVYCRMIMFDTDAVRYHHPPVKTMGRRRVRQNNGDACVRTKLFVLCVRL